MGIDFQDDDDDQDQFDAAFPNSQSQADNKAPTYSYKCLKLADVVRTRKEIIDDVAALLGVKVSGEEIRERGKGVVLLGIRVRMKVAGGLDEWQRETLVLILVWNSM